jgi:serine phosphatase RsbU (regulator of sigma subunit)
MRAALSQYKEEPMASTHSINRYALRCMEIWNGSQSVENEVSTPGAHLFVCSQPYGGGVQGGDVHYVSLCAGGVVTRLILADVSGHGAAVAGTSRALRALMRRFMNSKDQVGLVRGLNREFSQHARRGRFATAIVATHLSHRNRLIICNAGHPRPLWYQSASGMWTVVHNDSSETSAASNLPLGLDESTDYSQFEITVAEGDLLVLYTDALTEARDADGRLLGEQGLLGLASGISTDSANLVAASLLDRVRDFSGHAPREDDLTILVLKFVNRSRKRRGVREKLDAYVKLLGLKSV